MRFRHLLVSLVVFLSFAAPLAIAQQFSSVEERMSSSDFKAAGLDKLSPDELAKLNAFIRNEVERRTARARATHQQGQDRFGFHDDGGSRDSLVTRINGVFTGWNGHTKFVLNNGQVWQQIDSSAQFEGVRLVNPEISINPGFMGSFMLSVAGYNSEVRVKRIK